MPSSFYTLLIIAIFAGLCPNLSAQPFKPAPNRVKELRESGVAFAPYALFEPARRAYPPSASAVRKGTFLTLKSEQLKALCDARPDYIRLELLLNGEVVHVDLYQSSVLSADFKVETNLGKADYMPGVYYQGCRSGDYRSLASFSFFEDEVIGFLSTEAEGNLELGRLDFPGNTKEYIFYASADLLAPHPPFECRELTPPLHDGGGGKTPQGSPEAPGCIEVYIECDYELFQNKNSLGNTVNYVSGLFNQVKTLYDNEQISTKISRVYVWITPDDYSTSNANDALNEFRALRGINFTGDLAHLFSLGGNFGGVAYVDVLCAKSYGHAVSGIWSNYNNVPTYSWSVNVVAHEMGHNVGSRHTHWCGWAAGALDDCYTPEGNCQPGPTPTNGGTMMSYCHLVAGVGINFNNGFGPVPGALMRDETTYAANNNCIITNCPAAPSCNAPVNITVSAITANSAQISWAAVGGASNYSLQYRVVGVNTWTTVNNINSPYTINNINPETTYEFQLRSNCGGGSSPYYAGGILTTLPAGCATPTGLQVTAINNTSATIDWTQNGPAPTNWEVEYGYWGFQQGAGTVVTTTSRPYTITGLNHSHSYQCYVRANCSGDYSAWAGPLDFYTPLLNDQTNQAVSIPIGQTCNGVSPYNNIGATTSPNEVNPIASNGGYWATNASHTVWFSFVAPASGSVQITTDSDPQGSLTDTQVAVYSATNPSQYNTHRLLAANEDGGNVGAGYNAILYYTGLTAGTTYYIQVDGYGNEQGTFCLEVHENFALPNLSGSCVVYSETVNGASNPDKWFNIYTKPTAFNIGLPIAAVKTSQNLGTVTLRATRTASPPYAGSHFYMQRYLDFACSANPNSPKDVRLLYTGTELNNLMAASGYNGSAADLLADHYDGQNEDCNPGNNNGVTTVLAPVQVQYIGASDVFWMDVAAPGFSEIGARFPFSPLPVELLSFEARARERDNLLQWRAASEAGFKEYVPERSPDGYSDWRAIGAVAPRPDMNYAWPDPAPPARVFYRLMMRDVDGATAYSPIVSVFRDQDARGLLGLRPNPASTQVEIRYRIDAGAAALLIVADARGRVCYQTPLPDYADAWMVATESWPEGLYVVRVIGDGLSGEPVRFVVSR